MVGNGIARHRTTPAEGEGIREAIKRELKIGVVDEKNKAA
jgi:hypothetical protein